MTYDFDVWLELRWGAIDLRMQRDSCRAVGVGVGVLLFRCTLQEKRREETRRRPYKMTPRTCQQQTEMCLRRGANLPSLAHRELSTMLSASLYLELQPTVGQSNVRLGKIMLSVQLASPPNSYLSTYLQAPRAHASTRCPLKERGCECLNASG